jgi:hypothetical protein
MTPTRRRVHSPTNLAPSPQQLAEALTAWADGAHHTQAAVGLLAAHRHWLTVPGFVTACMGPCDTTTGPVMWWVDWDAVAAWDGPESSSERKIRLLAAELAGTPTGASLGDLLTGLDNRNIALALNAITHTAERHTPGVTSHHNNRDGRR